MTGCHSLSPPAWPGPIYSIPHSHSLLLLQSLPSTSAPAASALLMVRCDFANPRSFPVKESAAQNWKKPSRLVGEKVEVRSLEDTAFLALGIGALLSCVTTEFVMCHDACCFWFTTEEDAEEDFISEIG
ncbi:uncharacterized protein LOC111014268 [Momordica charantia]|uniref:Uncharacterized protein LOC111014268 n=1 Tax=Momordica charantia TaxID=3673 RepID=A0A6J1CU72_MOMCH|nr:uncharacterized protein LOC111014268 [Momordica charantia]